jgi:hypothetical protein
MDSVATPIRLNLSLSSASGKRSRIVLISSELPAAIAIFNVSRVGLAPWNSSRYFVISVEHDPTTISQQRAF